MFTIHKLYLADTPEQLIELPCGMEILDIQLQGSNWMIWYRFNKEMLQKNKWRIYRIGTGHDAPDHSAKHVSTIQVGPFVWHFFAEMM